MAYYGKHKIYSGYYNGSRVAFSYSAIGIAIMEYTLAGLGEVSLADLNEKLLSEMK